MTTRVFLLDDHEIVRNGVRQLLEIDEEFEVVGEASTATDALVRIPLCSPTVAVLDVRLPDMSGVEVCREIRSNHPDIGCIMLTSFSDDEALFDAIMAGASGYLLKQIKGSDLLDAVRRVAAGQSLLDPAVTTRVLERLRAGEPDDPLLAGLTEQERRVVELISEGLTNREIADRIHLAEKTVKNYVTGILAKLGMRRRTEVMAYTAKVAQQRQPHE